MSQKTALQKTCDHLGRGAVAKISRACNVSYQGAWKWVDKGVLPGTEVIELRGQRKTSYGLIIESLTNGAVTDLELRDDVLKALDQKSVA